MFAVCRLFISNYFHQCWNWKSRVLETCILRLVKACLILIFNKFSLLCRFSDVAMLWSGHSENGSFSLFHSPTLVKLQEHGSLQDPPLSVRYGWGWLKGQKPGDAEICTGMDYSASAWKRQKCVAGVCKKTPTFHKTLFSHLCFSVSKISYNKGTIAHEVSHNQVSVSGRHHFSTEYWMKSKAQIMRSIWGKQMLLGNVYGEEQIFGETLNYIFFKTNT